MKVKKYIVDSMPSALQKIRVDLGDNAVILNSKEVKTGGFLGFFRKRQIEVIAAAPSEQEVPKPKPASIPEAPSIPKVKKPVSTPNPAPAEPTDVIKEIQGMKELIMGMMAGEGSLEQRGAKPLGKWMERLKEQEVEPQVIQFFMEQMMRTSPDQLQEDQGHILQCLLQQMEKLIAEGSMTNPCIDRSVNFVSFVGPTGVGKTTTIAKLAADQVLNHNRRVGMVTSDTYRIAAVEQLKTYANILNVPVETVFSPDGLKKAMKNLKDCDLIFMDTTGRNYQEEQYVQEIGKYLSEPLVQENYLVLSMTSKYRDMKKIVDNFQSFPIDKIILTKLDETSSYGAVLNLSYHYPYPLAYVTTGQNVPEDITRVIPEQLAKLMLGVADHEDGSSAAS